MKSNFGENFRKIRKNKHITITSISDENLSKSQISRFERGESEISCIRLVNLLNKLHVSIEEFFSICDYSYNNSFISLINKIGKDYDDHNFTSIRALLDNQRISLTNIEKTMIKSIIHSFDTSFVPTKEELFELTEYLFKIENWNYYELTLLGNCVRTINYAALFTLTKEMIKKYTSSALNKTNKKIVIQLAINCLISSIDNLKFKNSHYLIDQLNCLLDNELFYYEKTVFLYAQGYLEFKENNIRTGKEKMKQAISIFTILNENNMLQYYAEHYNELILKNSNSI